MSIEQEKYIFADYELLMFSKKYEQYNHCVEPE